MVNTINMQDMRHINLFGKITQISTRFCFRYNEAIIFVVPKRMVSKAIGENGKNIRKISEILGKKIKVVPSPQSPDEKEIKKFIEAVVNPVRFNDLDVTEKEIIITAGSQNKAALLGRNKRRLIELQKIAHDFFRKDLRIV